MSQFKIALTAMAALAALTMSGPVQAWEPTKPIRIIVGFSPGGGTDVIARALVAAGQEFFPVPLVIVNRTGAGGTLAADFVAKSPPDGYTLLIGGGSESTSVPNHQKLTYSLDDFRPILRCNRLRNLMVIKADDSRYQTFDEFLKYAKAHPGELSYGSSGVGSLFHSTSLVLSREAGLEMKHVPYKGGAPALAALLGGHIDVTIATPDEVKAQYEAGNVKILALSSDDRVAHHPDVPTMRELGYNVYVENMKGVVAPAGISDDVYQYLHDNFKKAMETPAWAGLAKQMAIETGYLDGPGFMKAMKDMSDAIGAAVK